MEEERCWVQIWSLVFLHPAAEEQVSKRLFLKVGTVAAASLLERLQRVFLIAVDQVNGAEDGLLFFSSFPSLSGGSSRLHNSVGGWWRRRRRRVGGTARSARDRLIKFLPLQTHIHVHAVLLTQEAYAGSTANPTTPSEWPV